jgi:flavin reductase (DIM6/NTAB) family NADH-FMN oxidoreductase RutF
MLRRSRRVNLREVKVAIPVEKQAWSPSLLPGQIVLVSTVDRDGRPNVAPKSWVSMAAFGGPVVAFGCTDRHLTLRNAEATGEFALNVVPVELAPRIWAMPGRHGQARIDEAGLTLLPATQVSPPLVGDCPAHLECLLDDVKRYGEEAFVFGRVVAASIDADCLAGDAAERYARLGPVFFLENGSFARLGDITSLPRA